ncbi:hypothetical protein [Ruminococcus sp.]|uniref:hypothetical protein n=1 Tax=Ruminococcus sp. TaxID=41978 RepID=UPI0025EFD990|nr:hypothetical protein [Ruminococcus sp.]
MNILNILKQRHTDKPLSCYGTTVVTLFILEIINTIWHIIPKEIIWLFMAWRVVILWKAIQYLMRTRTKSEAAGDQLRSYFDTYLPRALIAYKALFVLCILDLVASTIASAAGFYSHVYIYTVVVLLQYALDVIGIAMLPHIYDETKNPCYRWIITNAAILIITPLLKHISIRLFPLWEKNCLPAVFCILVISAITMRWYILRDFEIKLNHIKSAEDRDSYIPCQKKYICAFITLAALMLLSMRLGTPKLMYIYSGNTDTPGTVRIKLPECGTLFQNYRMPHSAAVNDLLSQGFYNDLPEVKTIALAKDTDELPLRYYNEVKRKYGYVGTDGHPITKQLFDLFAEDFTPLGLARVDDGVINTKGEYVIKADWDDISISIFEPAILYSTEEAGEFNYYIADTEGKQISELTPEQFDRCFNGRAHAYYNIDEDYVKELKTSGGTN